MADAQLQDLVDENLAGQFDGFARKSEQRVNPHGRSADTP